MLVDGITPACLSIEDLQSSRVESAIMHVYTSNDKRISNLTVLRQQLACVSDLFPHKKGHVTILWQWYKQECMFMLHVCVFIRKF